jgi:RimJ/RimL family protein N-acetyltransferase
LHIRRSKGDAVRISLDPATEDDFRALTGRTPPSRLRAIVARLDGHPVGIGGLVYGDDGTIWASMLATPEVRRFPTAVYRGAVAAMRMAARLGLRRVFAVPDRSEPAAERFLERLGYEKFGEYDGETIYCWRGGNSEATREVGKK